MTASGTTRRLRIRSSNKKESTRQPKAAKIGFISPAAIERAFIRMLQATGVSLIGLSIVGSFYGLQGQSAAAPLAIPGQMLASPAWLVLAVATQGALSLTQWGSRVMARRDRRWWLLFAAALGVSAVLNWISYAPHLMRWGWPIIPVVIAVVIGDALAEVLVVG